jgi:catechol 2,3-dioxygenase-like lactoylglutathione lyase family enzyme
VLRGEDLYHTGIVVADLDQALDDLAARGGYRFAEPMTADLSIRTPAGQSTVAFRATYSCGPGPLVEVIQQVPGTHWTPVAGSGLHHLGYWVDDIEAESAALVASGVPLEAAGLAPDGRVMYSYHYGGEGIRYEIVDRMAKPFIDAWIADGHHP